jgi:hypothetical protein
MAKPNDHLEQQRHGEERGYQPPQRPGTAASEGKQLETGYVPPSRPLNNNNNNNNNNNKKNG